MSTLPATAPATTLSPIRGGVMPMGDCCGGRWLGPGVTLVGTSLRWRMRLLPLSAIHSRPLAAATPRGPLSWAPEGRPPSALNPGVPVPAAVDIVPAVSISRTLWLPVSPMKTAPSGVTATPCGWLSSAAGEGAPSPAAPRAPAPAAGGVGGGAAAPRRARRTGAGDGGDRAGGVDAPDAVVAGVGDQVAAADDRRDAAGRAEQGRGRGAPVAGEAGRGAAGHGQDQSASGDQADPVVAGVGDEEGAVGQHRHVARLVERGAGGGVPVAAEPGGAVAGDGRDRAGGVDAPDAVVAGVGDEEASVNRGRDAARRVQAGGRVGGGKRVAGEAPHRARARPGPGDGRDGAVVVHAADAVVCGVRDQG